MNAIARAARATLRGALAIGVVAATACGSDEHRNEARNFGTVTLPLLTTVGPNTYRLQAVFVISGAQGDVALSTSADESFLSTTLPAGSYSAYLQSFTLYKDDGTGTFDPIVATAESRTEPFTVFADSTTTVNFRFETEGTSVSSGSGNVNVTFGVTETAGQCESTFVRLALGGVFSCGIHTDSTLECWGYGADGELNVPSGTFIDVATGPSYGCAVRTDGTLVCWGSNDAGDAVPPSGTFQSIWAGVAYHTCGIRTDGTVACWGRNDEGQATPPAGTFRTLAMDFNATCGLRTDGTLACWGQGNGGVTPLPTGVFKSLAMGCAVRVDGSMACWGFIPAPTPTGTFLSVSVNNGLACALRTDGTLACWGSNEVSQATPPPGNLFTSVYTGARFACGVQVNGAIPCWGADEWGQAEPPCGPPSDATQCEGSGLVHTIPDSCMDDGGTSGGGDNLEVYCVAGRARFCLSNEACPWRTQPVDTPDTCERSGLSPNYPTYMASAWCDLWKGKQFYECDLAGQIFFPEATSGPYPVP